MPLKRFIPSDLQSAFQGCVRHAEQKKNLSVERIADLMGVNKWTLYKWLAECNMPSSLLAGFEQHCGVHYVTDYLVHGSNRLVIAMPSGRKAEIAELNQLSVFTHQVLASITQCYAGDIAADRAVSEITQLMQEMAYQQHNVKKLEQPELGLEEEQEHV